MRRFASEFWAPGFVVLVSLGAWWARAAGRLPAAPVPFAKALALCWALWGGALLQGKGRVKQQVVGWLVCAFAVAAVGSVLWPGDFLQTSLEVLLFLWAGVEYGRRLGYWAPPVVMGTPLFFLCAKYAAADVMEVKGVGWLSTATGPLCPLTGDALQVLLAVVLYSVPAVLAAGVASWTSGGLSKKSMPEVEKPVPGAGGNA